MLFVVVVQQELHPPQQLRDSAKKVDDNDANNNINEKAIFLKFIISPFFKNVLLLIFLKLGFIRNIAGLFAVSQFF